MEDLGKITNGKDVSLETKAKIIHSLIFPITVYRGNTWTVKRLIREELVHMKYSIGRELQGHRGLAERWIGGS